MTTSLLHIVVVLYNSADTFATMWRSLAAQTCRDWRVVAIYNNSADGSGAMLAALSDPRLEVVANAENVGFARAVNQGLRLAVAQGAERCMLLNPDTVLPPDFLANLLGAWTEHRWPVVAPRVMYADDTSRSWYAGGRLDYGWIFASKQYDFSNDDPRGSHEVGFANGCRLGLSAEAPRRVGLLDESFFVNWKDTDFSMRLKAMFIPISYECDPMLLHEGVAATYAFGNWNHHSCVR